MRYRILYKRERDIARELSQYSFRDPEPFADWYFAKKVAAVAGAFEGEILCAMGALVDQDLALRGARVPGGLLTCVTTRPDHRGQGVMNGFMPYALQAMRKRGMKLASLYPFDYGFYRRFGWETGTDVLRVRVPLADIPVWETPGRVILVEDASRVEALVGVYGRYMARRSAYAWRDERAFLRRLEEHEQEEGYAAVYERDGEAAGYLLYHVEGKIVSCDELVACDLHARKALLSYLARHASTLEEAAMALPPEDPVWRLIPDCRNIATLEPFAMYRVLDAVGAARGVSCGEGEVRLRIRDGQIPENDRVFEFCGKDGKLSCMEKNVAPQAELPVTAYAQWLTGYRSAAELADEGKAVLEAETAARMDALLPKQRTFLYEMY